jgi:uncharacterized protein YecT (DUF1311 family)
MLSVLVAAAVAAAPTQPNCDNAQAQADMNICAAKDFEAANLELNAQWKRTFAFMRQQDKQDDEPWASGPSYSQALLNAQRAWLTYREAQCTLESYHTRGGSMRPMLYSMCAADLTRERIQQLAEIVSGEQ